MATRKAVTKKTAAKKTPAKKAAAPPAAHQLIPPPGTVVVRMYRIGHGDCFLLAFPGTDPKKPVYLLIDCGYKPGSPGMIDKNDVKDIRDITANIREATGGYIDVAVITHEHQDHVNGISENTFKGIRIGQAWFAWTEDPADDLANGLRKQFKDRLLGLLDARTKLAAAAEKDVLNRVDELLQFEIGGDREGLSPASLLGLMGADGKADPSKSMNKLSMKVFKDKAEKGIKYLRPHEKILKVPGAKDIRAFVMGPPRKLELLETLDPKGGEEFHLAASAGGFFAAAASGSQDRGPLSPFTARYRIAKPAVGKPFRKGSFFAEHYGSEPTPASVSESAPDDADWRRIDNDWLLSAETLALAMSDQTNNASLVLAFELGVGGKVLLFVGDAQRGNWLSWSQADWKDGDSKVTAKDLLARTVLYKVGHHGSHNATLNGVDADTYPNLSWMARSSECAREFTAMITAVRPWAETQKGWDHPLKAIKDALLAKAGNRVFQTDTNVDDIKPADSGGGKEWQSFLKRRSGNRLYFDYTVEI